MSQHSALGFRPPQFSEDLAWVPGWLQQHHIQQFDECINLELPPKDFNVLHGNTNEGNYGDILSREQGRNNSYHLFLSGEDNSPAGSDSSPANVLHLHLRLSSNGSLQCSPTETLGATQNDLNSNRVSSLEHIDTLVSSKVETCSNTCLNLGGRSLLPLNSIPKAWEDIGPQGHSNNKISAMRIGETNKFKRLKEADTTAAVELSVAASEALVIHETVRTGFSSDVMPTAVILEAALRVKKARLEWSEEELDSIVEENDNTDSLSDLDDLSMADVYEDVGLSLSIAFDDYPCDLDISQVKETPPLENQYELVKRSSPEDLGAQDVKLDNISVQQLQKNLVMDRSKDNSPPNSFNCERDIFCDTLVPASKNCNKARDSHSSLQDSDILMKKQTGCPSMVNLTSYQPQEKLNDRQHNSISANAEGEDKVTYSDRFRSRWLGGWTGQEVSAVGRLEQNAKSIVKCLASESSFFSESADIAPDMNSFVQFRGTESHRTSQSSTHIAVLPDETNKDILLSQDVVRSSILSLADPLCSVVPCSIPSENEVGTLEQIQKDKKNDTEKCIRPTTELGMENLYKPSNLVIDHEDGEISLTHDEHSPVIIRRQFISLKTYSTLLPNNASIKNGGLYHNQQLECDQRLVTLDQNVGSLGSSDKSCKASFSLKPPSMYFPATDNKGNGTAVAQMKYQKRKYHGIVGDGNELPVHAPKKSKPFIVSNHRTSECKSLHNGDVSVKKRVHFSEAVSGQQNNLKRLQSSTKTCSTDREHKRRKDSKFLRQEKGWLTNSQFKAGKRLLFQGIQFLLTGFSRQKEKDIEGQIWKHGGIVLSEIPSLNPRAKRNLSSNGYQHPIILSSKKLQTTKFLYGCAVNAFILKADWLTSSISVGHILPPEKYIILSNRADAEHISIGKAIFQKHNYIFDRVGIMLHGKHSFFSKLAKIIKHGGGQVFKTLQRLVLYLEKEKVSYGAIVSGNESTSRHLRHCAAEKNIPIMPASWIIKSLHLGKLLPFSDTSNSLFPALKTSEVQFP